MQEEKSSRSVMLVVHTVNLFNITELKNGEADKFYILYIHCSRNMRLLSSSLNLH